MSGTRLPGDTEENDRHDDNSERFMTRLDGELRDRALNAVDEHGSKAELVRAALADYLPDYQEGPRIRPPDDDDLRTAFRTIQRLAGHRDGRVPMDEAASAVAQELGIKAQTVRNGTLAALAEKGYLIRQHGVHGRPQVRVFMPEDAKRIAQEINDDGGDEGE